MHYTADVREGCESYLIVTLDAEPISDSPFRLRVFCTEFANSVQKLPHATANNPLNEFTHTIRARVSIAFLSTFLSIASDAFSLSNRPSRRCLCCSCLESATLLFAMGCSFVSHLRSVFTQSEVVATLCRVRHAWQTTSVHPMLR